MDVLFKALYKITRSVFTDRSLRDYTTMGVGGAARYLTLATGTEQIVRVFNLCREQGLPCKLLGGGSNVIVSDSGFPGVVVINRANRWEVLSKPPEEKTNGKIAPRLTAPSPGGLLKGNIVAPENTGCPVLVRADSGVRLTPLAKHLYRENVFGLQWFSGIPATVGGAIYMNMHGGPHYFGDLVITALLYNGQKTRRVDADYFKFDYDHSVLRQTGEIVLEAELLLQKGETGPARQMAREWAREKSRQPQKSAGCIFQNLSAVEQKELGLPSPSIGYLIDKVLGLKGLRKGDAVISAHHAAFIENLGQASASDVHYLYRGIRDAAWKKLHLELKTEVEFIGPF